MTQSEPLETPSERESRFKLDWIEKHGKADDIVADAETKELVAAVYYYPVAHHKADQKKIWRMIGLNMELKRLEEYEDD